MPEILTESFCERCGTRYTFESAAPRAAKLKGIKVLSRGLKNFVMSDDTSMDEAMAAARSETDREVTSQQLDAFHKTFNFCMSCRQYTCGNCWNEAEGRCLSCAPHLGHEILPAPFPDVRPTGSAAEAIGLNGNGHVPAEPVETLAWPSMDLDRLETEDEGQELEPIDAAARLAALGSPAVSDAVVEAEAEAADAADVEAVAVEPETAAAADVPAVGVEPEAAPAEAVAAEPIVDAPESIEAVEADATADRPEADAAADRPEADAMAEPLEADAVTEIFEAVAQTAPVEPEIDPGPVAVEPTPTAHSEALRPGRAAAVDAADVPGRAAAAAAQTTDLLRRFRPGQNLDAEIEAYEREQAAGRPADDVAAIADVERSPVAEAPTSSVEVPAIEAVPDAPGPAASGMPVAEVEPLTTAGQPVDTETPVAASEPDVVADLVEEAEPPLVAAAATAELAPEPEPAPAPHAAPSPVPPADVVHQPTWRIVAPEHGEPTAPTAPVPPTPTPGAGQPAVASAEPQWPSTPEWPSHRPSAGLPFLNRPAQPTGGLDSLWAESAREVTAAPTPLTLGGAPARPAGGVQPCVSCGLSLSATARFCRRCGTRQG